MIKITADIFSGRPNPFWELNADEKEVDEILKAIKKNRNVISSLDSGFQGLGYRGLQIELLSDDLKEIYDLPTRFKIANGGSKDLHGGIRIATRIAEGMDDLFTIERFKLKSIPTDEKKKHEFEIRPVEGIKKRLLNQIEKFPEFLVKLEKAIYRRKKLEDIFEPIKPKRVCCNIELCSFNPDFWNNDPDVKWDNNCYNYARNCRTDTFAQPGRASGITLYQYNMNCTDVSNAALADGAHERYDCFPDSEKPRFLMALVIDPNWDYHWYRKHCEGFWGHKPGHTSAKNTDNSGDIIYDPNTCDRGGYTEFCGYFYSCKSMIIE